MQQRSTSREGNIGLWLTALGLAALSLIVPAVVLGSEGAICAPITYAFHGSPPPHAVAELELGVREVHRHTGFVFEEGDPDTAKLHVAWSDRGLAGSSFPALANHGRPRFVGYGHGRWRDVVGGRSLVEATIAVDATFAWTLGLGRGDSLAAMFVHELGHVVGLPHSTNPTSFMYPVTSPRPRGWTEDERALLARAGHEAGCQIDEPSAKVVPAGDQMS